jgi:hypothetical protein
MEFIAKKEVRKKVFDKYRGHCAYCGVELCMTSLRVDHIEPLKRHLYRPDVRKHLDVIDNLNPSCVSCNSSKSSLSLEMWRVEISEKHNMLLRYDSTYRLLHRFGMLTINNNFKFYFERNSNVL